MVVSVSPPELLVPLKKYSYPLPSSVWPWINALGSKYFNGERLPDNTRSSCSNPTFDGSNSLIGSNPLAARVIAPLG